MVYLLCFTVGGCKKVAQVRIIEAPALLLEDVRGPYPHLSVPALKLAGDCPQVSYVRDHSAGGRQLFRGNGPWQAGSRDAPFKTAAIRAKTKGKRA